MYVDALLALTEQHATYPREPRVVQILVSMVVLASTMAIIISVCVEKDLKVTIVRKTSTIAIHNLVTMAENASMESTGSGVSASMVSLVLIAESTSTIAPLILAGMVQRVWMVLQIFNVSAPLENVVNVVNVCFTKLFFYHITVY